VSFVRPYERFKAGIDGQLNLSSIVPSQSAQRGSVSFPVRKNKTFEAHSCFENVGDHVLVPMHTTMLNEIIMDPTTAAAMASMYGAA